uniref:RING-CH-type domain-containing protein n=1 Tax=Aureoumbra lagunensis TaxID=44058 RepID=A0A7S3JSN3_9STRA
MKKMMIGDDKELISSVELRQCRFCLEVEEVIEEEKWVCPCNCIGSQKYVHRACLDRWRRTRERRYCHVCTAEFNVPPPPVLQRLFVKDVRTAPRYNRPVQNLVAEESFRQMIRIGSVIAQSTERAESEAVSLARSGEQQRPDISWRDHDGRRPGLMPSTRMASIIIALLESRALRHWHRGVFLILYIGTGAGTDGSDSIVAANLTRQTNSLGEHRDDLSDLPQRSTIPVPSQAPGLNRRFQWLRSAAHILRREHQRNEEDIIDENHQEEHAEQDTEADFDEDDIPSLTSPTSSSSDDDNDDNQVEFGHSEISNAIHAYRSIQASGVQCAAFSGGPVHREQVLGLLLFEGISDLEPLLTIVEPHEAEQWHCEDASGLLSTLPVLARLVPIARNLGATNIRLLAWSGFAVWSADQLISEIARGSWVLSTINCDDLQGVIQQADSETSRTNQLWHTILNDRTSTMVPTLLAADEEM